MSDDPVRLLEQADNPLLLKLLSAARSEQPSRAGVERALLSVGVGGALVAAGASSAASVATALAGAPLAVTKGVAASTALIVVKWLGLGILVGVVASAAAVGASNALSHRAPTAPTPLRGAPAAPTRVLHVPTPIDVPAPASADSAELPAEPVATPAIASRPPLAVSTRPSDPGPSLAAEVAALDSARQALRNNDAAGALTLLSDYEQRFAAPRMLPEALDLRLQALTALSDEPAARALARRILSSFPASPHALRARAVLQHENQ